MRHREKGKFGAIKKSHKLHTIWIYSVARHIVNPKAREAYTYRSSGHGPWQPVIKNIEFERLLQRILFLNGLENEKAREDGDKACEEAELYQTPPGRPPNEEIQNRHGSITQQTGLSEDGIGPTASHSVSQSSPEPTNTATAVKCTREPLAELHSVISNNRKLTPRKPVRASLTRLPSKEAIVPEPQTTSSAASIRVNSMAEGQVEMQNHHNRVEASSAGARPAMKQARRHSDRISRKKRCASLEKEFKRLSRIQQIHEQLNGTRTQVR
ncbi:hypothetical protein HRR83_002598 [Exophiala dermatitidis]|uniref:Uncharacterized protein n=2 Tax=Exophiala dermatitidis TaxID=5970 RepID=H6BZP5_EXODN|nr:uncharacterized protein HMPREF1120_05149 [Exophiala dermatitidis NIH/UT8656]KAJ4514512.1 hypothetical protein HRR73_005540 [Exophiala dermatitidis]EHY57099.1 hypothetical protein HMPREF1120_05149 [Exophiala dermatitidis NIH/UT8656]KAJ4523720.1 hypothetical protein HRR74_001913 [Exophiala dermatitidis]KAJ4537341.1 hypothetical protein HRR76_005352 [Exophiala dermatitidis]KAJ4555061.1 hypothetical protein HRR77_001005 [Exophiala dermatitidis]